MSRSIRPVLERHDPRAGGSAQLNDIMSIQSVVDAPPGDENGAFESSWGFETPGGFFPRPYGEYTTQAASIGSISRPLT